MNLFSLLCLRGKQQQQLQAFVRGFEKTPISLTVAQCFMEPCDCWDSGTDSWHRRRDKDSPPTRQRGSSVRDQTRRAMWYGFVARRQKRGLLRVLRHWSQALLKLGLLLFCLRKMMTEGEEHKKEGWLVCARHDTESEAASNSLFWRMRHWTLRAVLLERTSYK